MAERASAAKAVIAISSHVVRGSVGNRAVVFALEHLGHPVWSLPTVIVTWHPGHGPATRMVPPSQAFGDFVSDLIAAPWLGEVGGILSGFLGEAAQAGHVARLVEAVKARNPDALYLCDPVIGDAGGLYVPEATAVAIRDELIPLANVATPNVHELAWLAGAPLVDNASVMEAALSLGPGIVVATSAHASGRGQTGNLLLSATNRLIAEHGSIVNAPNGLGDLFAALFLSRLMNGMTEKKALQSATASVFEILARTAKRNADELTLESDADSLVHPAALVSLRTIDIGAKRS